MGEPYYRDDHATLYLGDCRDVLPDLAPVDLVLTDPPYGVTYESNHAIGRTANTNNRISNDGTRLSLALYRSVLPLLRANHVLWATRWDAWPDVWALLGQYWPLRGLLVWDKGSPGMGDLNHWGPSYELYASAGYGKTVGSRDQSVLRFPKVSSTRRHHPTEKPLPLLTYLIGKLDPSSLLDPFAGSGTALVAAKNLKVPAIGVELDERYCEVAAKRLAGVDPRADESSPDLFEVIT
jgi:site-specific DNA-methyltransferase (adenine-specific)